MSRLVFSQSKYGIKPINHEHEVNSDHTGMGNGNNNYQPLIAALMDFFDKFEDMRAICKTSVINNHERQYFSDFK